MNDNAVTQGLYDPSYDRDSCGVTLVADLHGHPSHEIVRLGMQGLARMEHRGALGADGKTGDGVGILTQIPDTFFRRYAAEHGVTLPAPGAYAIGMFFLPQAEVEARSLQLALEKTISTAHFRTLLWRHVPTTRACLGPVAEATEPSVWQVFIAPQDEQDIQSYRKNIDLFVLGRLLERTAKQHAGFAVVSLSDRTVVYKGMMLAHDLDHYYPDLKDPAFVSALAIVHARFSTNTFPSWKLAQPFRRLCHNGEINTLRGNLQGLISREKQWAQEIFAHAADDVLPLVQQGLSDSAYIDLTLELLLLSGKSLAESLMILIPEAWQKDPSMPADLRAFYEYHAPLMEPWDGPAAIIATDGQTAAIALDRNGLRPCRYTVTKHGLFVASSEAGAVPLAFHDVLTHGRLAPGEILMIDPDQGGLVDQETLKKTVANRYDYASWIRSHLQDLAPSVEKSPPPSEHLSPSLTQLQIAVGMTSEETLMVLKPMAQNGEEPISSMGDDTPLAVLSDEPRLLFDFFRQQFAQVTNPPIDPLREDLVMSLDLYLGRKGSLLRTPSQNSLLRLSQPILTAASMATLNKPGTTALKRCQLSTLVAVGMNGADFARALASLAARACKKVHEGWSLIILSDRGLSETHAALPSLLAISAVHQELIRQGLRNRVDLVVETAEARTVHHMATLIGYGAQAIHPYLALATVESVVVSEHSPQRSEQSDSKAQANYIKALTKGLLKVLSKMGISTLRSYHGAHIFEAIGLAKALIHTYFPGTVSALDGWDLNRIAASTWQRHQKAFATKIHSAPLRLQPGGEIHYRKEAERHAWRPDTIAHLQHAARTRDPRSYEEFKNTANAVDSPPHYLRHLLDVRPTDTKSLPVSEVEDTRSILRQFTTGAMSLGAISREAHETLALAMNKLGGKSNTGEGGEDKGRQTLLPDGSSKLSAIRQVASGRFGVTLEYLAQGQELQIKMAQGAKPGEGGQLPGHKVDSEIAKLRHSTPGVGLISPPPHHDIYSIEDLAQLIYDLKKANPRAKVSVKLVSASGIGAVAAGVAKAGADKIVVSCGSGGTGASPLSSIKHAGLPWELGLAETHQTLVINGLRPWVKLEVDGQLKTGRDVVIGAMLGADEFGFATAPLIASGCIMMRKCHLNTCPVGIATQDPELRAKFQGKPDHVINYLFFVAEEAQSLLASLGLRSLAQARGRTDLLVERSELTKPRGLDLKPLLYCPKPPSLSGILPQRPVALTARSESLENGPITTAQRSFGTSLACERYLQEATGASLAPTSLTVEGYAGQSFGAFLTRGVTLSLRGIANDYVGKGLSGGRIIITPPIVARFGDNPPATIGNTVLYGATSGELFVSGSAGERFAVRNSGATAVVEGTGNHGCEYMTGGIVVVLGKTGRNFAAGMSGGFAYVFDEDKMFYSRVNRDMVDLESLAIHTDPEDVTQLRRLLAQHQELTGSLRAQAILANWDEHVTSFVKVIPKEYKAALQARRHRVGRPLPHSGGEDLVNATSPLRPNQVTSTFV